jgi:Uncharacterized YmpT-like
VKNKLVIFGVAAIFFALIFGGIAYQQFAAEKMDEVYKNIGYCTLFLSIAVYIWHVKDEKKKNSLKRER